MAPELRTLVTPQTLVLFSTVSGMSKADRGLDALVDARKHFGGMMAGGRIAKGDAALQSFLTRLDDLINESDEAIAVADIMREENIAQTTAGE